MKLLVVGGCGFLGSNLASHGIEIGYDVTVFDNLSRLGAASNLEWLKTKGTFEYIHGDTRNKNDVENLIKDGQFDAVFHLADAYDRFFKKQNHFPKFKSKRKSKKSYTTNFTNNNILIGKNVIKLPKVGMVKAVIHKLPKDD